MSNESLTKNFKISEFKCKDGTSVPDDLVDNVVLLCENLQALRDHIGKPIRVISGYRSRSTIDVLAVQEEVSI